MNPPPRIYLIDISSFIFRAFFAIRRLTNSKGVPVNAVYGVTTMLLNLIEKEKPDCMVCVFDTPAPSFRKEIYPEYKANRGEPPDDLKPQFGLIVQAINAMKIKRVSKPGFEADDIIATLVKEYAPENASVTIVTGDKDLMQLVTDKVNILDTMKNVVYGPAQVKEKMGVGPEFITDFLGLTGDTSDNIPGVPGIGPKSAVELINEFGRLEDIIRAIPRMKEGRRKTNLSENADVAILSKKLATVRDDLKDAVVGLDVDSMKTPADFKGHEFIDFLREMNFNSLLKKYGQDGEPVQFNKEFKKVEARNKEDLQVVLLRLEKTERVVMEPGVEGEGEGKISSLTLAFPEMEVMIRMDDKSTLGAGFVIDEILSVVLANKLVSFIGYDLKNFAKQALQAGVNRDKIHRVLSEQSFDLMIAHYVLNPEDNHDLELLKNIYLKSAFSSVMLADYFIIEEGLRAALKTEKLFSIFKEIEMPLVAVLAGIEVNGVRVNTGYLKDLSKEYAGEIQQLEKKIFDCVGYPFNLNSPKQLGRVLFDKLKLPILSKTKTGYSTDAEVLHKLSLMHEVPARILRYRELNKLKTTYVDVLPNLVKGDGRVHAHFNQAVTATGRLSSSNPNLQNIPIKTASGRRIRKAFVADEGYVLVGADYSQIELRVVAHLAQDEALIAAFRKNLDVHSATAAEIFGIDLSEVTSSQRNAAKAINFGLIYGKTAFSLASELDITRSEAQKYIDLYFQRYKGVKAYMDECIKKARLNGLSHTMFGRRRIIKDIANKNIAVRNFAERTAINTPVQGTAADIIKLAMLKISKFSHEFKAKFILQVHDEIVLEVPRLKALEVKEILKREMENVVELSVPMLVVANVADNWMEL